MYFLALSQAAPPVVIESATHTPGDDRADQQAAEGLGAESRPTTIGTTAGISAGSDHHLAGPLWVTMSTQVR